MAFYKLAVEVPLFLTVFSSLFTGSIYTNLIVFRTCYVTLGYNKTDCALLGMIYNNDTTKLEQLVEPHAAIINTVRSTTESALAVFLCLFLGPWSDRFGRKPVLICCLTGYTISYLGSLIFSWLQNLSPWYSILCAIPITLTGGTPTYFTICLSYISDVSNKNNRGIRMAIFDGVLAGGMLLGSSLSSYVFYATNYISMFAIAAAACGLGILYTIFFIPESLQNYEIEGKLRGFFQISNIVEMVRTAVKKRQNFNRALILLFFPVMVIYVFIMNGDTAIVFLYLREKFLWTLTKYTLYSSVTNVITIAGGIGGICILYKLLNIKETILLVLGFGSLGAGAILLAIANNDYYIYAAGVIRCLGGVVAPLLNSLASKLVPEDEIGKLFTMTMALQFTIGLAASPIYTFIYNSTLSQDSGAYNYLSVGLYTLTIILMIAIMIMDNINQRSYNRITNEDDESNETESQYE